MKLEAQREALLRPLQCVIGVVERRQTLPVLSNVLAVAEGTELKLTTTDLEVELMARAEIPIAEAGTVTLPARKLLDILRALPEEATVSLAVEGSKATLRCGKSRYSLATLPAADFPVLDDLPFEGSLRLSQGVLKNLIERTHFAMAQQDVRYYLNGLLLEAQDSRLTAVATDGHRLALCTAELSEPTALGRQVIVPRKGVQELLRLLGDGDTETTLNMGPNHIQITLGDIRFTSKLIDGKFPDYQRVIPHRQERIIVVNRLLLREALARAAILASDSYRGVRLIAKEWTLHVQAHNPEQEEANEEIEVNYDGEPLEIGFNVNYLLDALAALPSELVNLCLNDANSSCLLQEPDGGACKYVIMPMRL